MYGLFHDDSFPNRFKQLHEGHCHCVLRSDGDILDNLVDTIKSDSRGLAVSRQLPLGRYTIRETKAPVNYSVSGTDLTAYLEHKGQIVCFGVTNKSLSTGVAITKTGPSEAMAGQPVNYTFSNITNSSNVRLDNFYWRDTLPAEVRLSKILTGTYKFPGTYKITYRVNGGEPQTSGLCRKAEYGGARLGAENPQKRLALEKDGLRSGGLL